MGDGADVVHSLLSRDSLHISFPERGGTAPLSSLQTSVVGERLVVVGRMTGRPSCDIMNVVPLLLPPFSLNKILRIKSTQGSQVEYYLKLKITLVSFIIHCPAIKLAE